MRLSLRLAPILLSLALVAAGPVRAAPVGQADEASDAVWLQNHVEVTLWSDSTASTDPVATIPQFAAFFRARPPLRREHGRILVYYPGDTTGVPPGLVWVDEEALGPSGPRSPGMLDRSPPPVQSLDDIFLAPPAPITGRNAERIRTLIATGDVIPARNVDSRIRARGNDFLYPVAETAEVLREADLTLINLEAPLIEQCPHHPGDGFQFCGQAGFVEALVHAGVDVASLENNHIGNYGPMGTAETTALLHEHGIDHTDRGTLAVRDVRGQRFGFLAFNGVGEVIDRAEMVATISQAAGQVKVLVVSVHWGREYTAVPQAAPGLAPDDPVEIAHLAIDAGADLVIGNHPHWIQAVELYNGKLIAYAHGNFIFDQAWSLRTRQGVVGRYTFYDDRLVRVEYLPVQIEGAGQPRFLDGDAAQAVLDWMYEASQSLAQQIQDGLRT
jgi:poly-gamma-glutamate synthesis protein (capsule biosynthesis protein)